MKRRDLLLLLGGVMGAPGALRAQQKAMPVVGYLGSTSPGPNAPFVAEFQQGLAEAVMSRGKTWRPNTAEPTVIIIGCPHWPPILLTARSMSL
jgi:hypothetical protein